MAASLVFSSVFLLSLARELTCKEKPEERLQAIVLQEQKDNQHYFRMSVSQRANLEQADKSNAFIYLGQKWETWLPAKLNTKPIFEDVQETDPHIWNSVVMTVKLAIRLKVKLAELQPQFAAEREKCLFAFQARATNFLNESKTMFAKIPNEKRVVGVEHNGFAFLSQEYGVRFVSLSNMAQEGGYSPNQMATFVQNLKKDNVQALLDDASHPSSTLKAVSKSAKIPIAGKLYSEGLGPKGSGAETIEKMWLHNRDTLLKALK